MLCESHICSISSTLRDFGATTVPLLNNVCNNVFKPPMWSNKRKFNVLNVGRGVSNLLKKELNHAVLL